MVINKQFFNPVKQKYFAVEYELKELERIVSAILNPTYADPKRRKTEFLANSSRISIAEKIRIKEQFIEKSVSCSNKRQLKLYFRQHQMALIEMADLVFNYLQPKCNQCVFRQIPKNSELKQIEAVLMELEDLLNYMARNFPSYFDDELKVTERLRWELAAIVKQDIKKISSDLNRLHVPEHLGTVICKPLEALLSPEIFLNYREYYYLKEFYRKLVEAIGKAETDFTKLLLYLNFNSIWFFNFYVVQLKEISEGIDSDTKLIAFYALKLKELNQVIMKAGVSYKPKLPSIKDQIGGWICEELFYLEKKHQLKYSVSPKDNNIPANQFKVETDLSVAELSLGLKLLIETGVIRSKNSSELMRTVAKGFRSRKQDSISEDSLRNKYYNVESGTANSVKDLIIGLLNTVRKY